MVDFGYDISDYYSIQTEYGTLEDLDELICQCKERGLKVFLDFVPNHTSDQHEWFQLSENKTAGYEDYYIWHDGNYDNATDTRSPPNNWVSEFRYSAWTWSTARQQYYYHNFEYRQPDLNYRNAQVVQGMKDIMIYWLGRGVSGFRIDAVRYMYEVEPFANGTLRDEPLSGLCNDPDSFCYLNHIYTEDLDETYEMIYDWRDLIDEYARNYSSNSTLVMLTESYASLNKTLEYYGTSNRTGSHIPFNFQLLSNVNNASTAADFKTYIDSWLDLMPSGKVSNWVMGNHDNKRLATKFGAARVDLLNIMLQTLPGVAITYNGEELGMEDGYISWNDTVDPQGCNTNESVYQSYTRDPERTPFQWDDTLNAGFSTGSTTWLPVASTYKTLNVKVQKQAPKSHLKVFQKLIQLRKLDTFKLGSFDDVLINANVYAFVRRKTGAKTYVTLLNFGYTSQRVNLLNYFTDLPPQLQVVVASISTNYGSE